MRGFNERWSSNLEKRQKIAYLELETIIYSANLFDLVVDFQ